MFKKILGVVATAAIALGANSAQAVTVPTITGNDQGFDIEHLTLSVGEFTDTYQFNVDSVFDLRLESSLSFVSYLNVNPFTVTLSACTNVTCTSSSVIGSFDPLGNNGRSFMLSPIVNGSYFITVSGNVLSGASNRYSGQANFFNVPEPATMGLFGLGLAAVGFVRRRRIAA